MGSIHQYMENDMYMIIDMIFHMIFDMIYAHTVRDIYMIVA